MGSTGDPRGEPRPTLRAGGVLALVRRGARGRSGHAAGRLPSSAGYLSGLGAPYPILSTGWPVGSVTFCHHVGR